MPLVPAGDGNNAHGCGGGGGGGMCGRLSVSSDGSIPHAIVVL